jgi:hypothetical protein
MTTTIHRIITSIVVAIALAAGAATASARPFDLNANGSYVLVPPAGTQTSSQSPQASTPATILHVTAGTSGFDWGDAGIGAAGGLAISIVGLGGGLAASQRRARRMRHTTRLIA